jgi:hypothetical protein
MTCSAAISPCIIIFLSPRFYEFLPLLFSLLAIRLWAVQQRLNKVLGYWLLVLFTALIAYSFWPTGYLISATSKPDCRSSNTYGLIMGY